MIEFPPVVWPLPKSGPASTTANVGKLEAVVRTHAASRLAKRAPSGAAGSATRLCVESIAGEVSLGATVVSEKETGRILR